MLSLQEVSAMTRIPVPMLQSLESEAYEQMPADVFVRGFIKSYARAIGLDEQSLVGTFDASHVPAPSTVIRRPRAQKPAHLVMALSAATVFALILLVFAMMRRPTDDKTPIELSLRPPCQTQPSSQRLCYSGRSTMVSPTASSRC